MVQLESLIKYLKRIGCSLNRKKSCFLTAEAVLVIAFTTPPPPHPPPPLSNSVQNFSKSVIILLGHFYKLYKNI